jgi:hypothetical protein
MARFTSTWFAGLAVAWLVCGCTGQSLEGNWNGPFPFEDAQECRIRIWNNSDFDLSCRGDNVWLGLGRWRQDGDTVSFTFEALAKRGEPVRPLPDPLVLNMAGRGATIDWTQPIDGRKFRWKRAALP